MQYKKKKKKKRRQNKPALSLAVKINPLFSLDLSVDYVSMMLCPWTKFVIFRIITFHSIIYKTKIMLKWN